MKVLFLLRYSPEQASSRVRGLFVAEELRKRGIKCHIICGYGKKAHMSFLARFFIKPESGYGNFTTLWPMGKRRVLMWMLVLPRQG